MKPTGNELIDYCIKQHMGDDETILLADGLENAFMGIGRQFTHPVAIYSYKKVIKILMRNQLVRGPQLCQLPWVDREGEDRRNPELMV